MEKDVKVKSLAKAMSLLECFLDANPELGITELAYMLGTQKSTVHNIVSTFETLGYISQNKETGKYTLGLKLLQYSYIINKHLGLQKVFLPYMRQISNELHETVYLGIEHEYRVLYIECCYPRESSGGRNILGEHAPMHCTGLGKVMLAFMRDDHFFEKIMPLMRFTEATIVDPERLQRELGEIRLRGYAVDRMEHEYGISCVAVPVYNQARQVIAAVSISGPSLRFSDEVIKQNAERMNEILLPIQLKM